MTAAERKRMKILNSFDSAGVDVELLREPRRKESATSTASPMKTQMVMTWKLRPAMLTSTATLLPPEEVDESPPPAPWRESEIRSHGMKTQ